MLKKITQFEKGFDFLLKAIPEVLANDCRIQFQIVGDGPEFDELKRLQSELNLEDKVQFLEFHNDVPLLGILFNAQSKELSVFKFAD